MRALACVMSGLLCAAMANAECVYPKAPGAAPDGLTATEEEMLAGMRAVKDYQERVQAYLQCLENETNERIEAAGPDATPEQIAQIKAIHAKRHNAAVEELEAHAERFNEQVRVYKSRKKS
ncbi:MAG: hypothetical protein C0P74_011355 [Gammaproteobacteria bacterium]